LKIEGTTVIQACNFAGFSRINLRSNTQYELRGWVKIESIFGDAPSFKMEWVKPKGGVAQVSSTVCCFKNIFSSADSLQLKRKEITDRCNNDAKYILEWNKYSKIMYDSFLNVIKSHEKIYL